MGTEPLPEQTTRKHARRAAFSSNPRRSILGGPNLPIIHPEARRRAIDEPVSRGGKLETTAASGEPMNSPGILLPYTGGNNLGVAIRGVEGSRIVEKGRGK